MPLFLFMVAKLKQANIQTKNPTAMKKTKLL